MHDDVGIDFVHARALSAADHDTGALKGGFVIVEEPQQGVLKGERRGQPYLAADLVLRAPTGPPGVRARMRTERIGFRRDRAPMTATVFTVRAGITDSNSRPVLGLTAQ